MDITGTDKTCRHIPSLHARALPPHPAESKSRRQSVNNTIRSFQKKRPSCPSSSPLLSLSFSLSLSLPLPPPLSCMSSLRIPEKRANCCSLLADALFYFALVIRTYTHIHTKAHKSSKLQKARLSSARAPIKASFIVIVIVHLVLL